jgi:hypothetical protein
MTIRQRVKIKPGGTIEIRHPELPEGEEVEVVITLDRHEDEPPSSEAGYASHTRPVWERVVEIGARIPREEWEKVPKDLSINLDHYLYGAPKEEK